ncbi:Dbl homology domain-containing protein [Tuber magnatum]|uniref:Dbl homology domain-containing protein n=1 Tax=Tuber magnatum TaxID=42249 RepID=A0A317SMR7_9PEZI|nr:Dbl homology domain-containing protein [Tuber magnatum]
MSMEDESLGRKDSAVALDNDTIARMRDRRCALEELINTEEYYIADLKVLVNLYMSILDDCEGIPADIRDAITRNVSEILSLHEKLLEEIFHALPAASHQIQTYKGRSFGVSSQAGEFTGSNVLANPMAAAKVAMVFDKMIGGFFVYEEYCAKYELVCEKFKEFCGSSWSLRERGCETLAGAINSQDNKEEYGKRALALADMLVKPIQRICKYPLLFAEMVKCTPAMDCPESNQLLDKVRFRLEEAAHQINLAAVNGPKIRDRMEKTWLLQDRLSFKDKPDCSVRLLGQIVLCGALHVAWQGPTVPVGEYMACLLYKSYLLLARIPKSGDTYDVKFAISLGTARMEEANRGQGLNCYSALFSWKIIFEAGHRIYEVLLSACSAAEEEVWRSRIAECIAEESKDYDEYGSAKLNIIPVAISDIRSLGHVFGRPGTLARRQSLHRPGSTPLPKSDVIIINNTHALSEVIGSKSASGLSRSASVLHAGQMTVLSPKRTERNRIESRLTDVWTRDQLAYGSMASGGVRRRDASNLMRRLSAVSLVSSARRSIHGLHSSGSSSEASWTQSWEIAGNADPGILMGVPLNVTDGARTRNSHPRGVSRRGYTLSRAFSFSGRSADLRSVLRRSGSSSLESKSEEALKGNVNAADEESKLAEVRISVNGPDGGARRKRRRSLRPRRLRGLGLD